MALNNVWRQLPFRIVQAVGGVQQVRTTYVVERVTPVRLHKPHRQASLRQGHHVYITLEDNIPKPQRLLKILLRKHVEDVGNPGEIVSVKQALARFLIMTNQASYPNKGNLTRLGAENVTQRSYSSKYVAATCNQLSKLVVSVKMNRESPWTLEPWHVRVALRHVGVHAPDSAITLPQNSVSGPDPALENKEFFVNVTVNGQEKAIVRCRLHHWSKGTDELPKNFGMFPAELMFPEDKELAKSLPPIIPPEHDDDSPLQPRPRMRRLKKTIKWTELS